MVETNAVGVDALRASASREAPKGKPRQIARALANAIVSEDLTDGSFIAPENELAKQFGVGRPVIREALHSVAAAGLVETRRGVGSYVLGRRAWNLFDPLVMEAYVSTGSLPRVLNELMELRRLVEIESAAIAAERIRDTGVIELADWLERMSVVINDPDQTAQADIAFHSAITTVADNRFLSRIVQYMKRLLVEGRYLTSRAGGVGGRKEALEAHWRIYEAIRARDPDAARDAMKEHVQKSESDLRRAILRASYDGETSVGGG